VRTKKKSSDLLIEQTQSTRYLSGHLRSNESLGFEQSEQRVAIIIYSDEKQACVGHCANSPTKGLNGLASSASGIHDVVRQRQIPDSSCKPSTVFIPEKTEL
jgi:hypothetical protein